MESLSTRGRRPPAVPWPAGRGFVVAGLLGAAVAVGACERGPAPTSREVLEGSTFLTLEGVDVTLIEGSGAVGGVRHELLLTAEGDLDFDSEPDAAAVLVADQGRERFLTLHALLREEEAARDVSARLIGDRIEVHRLTIADGVIRVDVRIRRPGDPVTARPSVDVAQYFMLTNRGVLPIRLTDVVEEGPATVAGPGDDAGPDGPRLHTHEWELESFDVGDWSANLRGLDRIALRFVADAFDGADITGQVSGFAGCNQVFGSFRTRESAALRFLGLATTRRSCRGRASEVEQRLTEALGSVQAFRLSEDRLVLALPDGAIRFRAGGRLVPVTPEPVDPEAAGDADRSN
ncbi:META domain-containing protein [Candidatus Palauibacter sp.]|uniref:META domain-containing protein n=1 Tax=Candidatus Palauibacter sp. TaxID=3101350 RepID=UPI003B01084D